PPCSAGGSPPERTAPFPTVPRVNRRRSPIVTERAAIGIAHIDHARSPVFPGLFSRRPRRPLPQCDRKWRCAGAAPAGGALRPPNPQAGPAGSVLRRAEPDPAPGGLLLLGDRPDDPGLLHHLEGDQR